MVSRTFVRRSIGVALVVAALVGQSMAGFFTQELIAEAAILAILALSLDLVASAGLVSFGHAGLLGVGCYVFAGLTVLGERQPELRLSGGDRCGRPCRFCRRPVRGAHGRRVLHHGDAGDRGNALRLGLSQQGVQRRRRDGRHSAPRPDRDRHRPQRPVDICAHGDRHLCGHLAAARARHVLAVRPHAPCHPAESGARRRARRTRLFL